MKIKYLLPIFASCALAVSTACNELDGDNSDFDFGDFRTEEKENPYENGFGRLDGSIRLATYNTHRCAGPSPLAVNYDNTARVISLIDADVIALQELDKHTRNNPADQLQELADRTGMIPYFCKTIDYNGGEYGIGILCKEKPLRTYSATLPGVEMRKFFLAEFDDFVFIATHFCHKDDANREASVGIINDYLRTAYSAYTKPIFLAGDLNEYNASAGSLKALFSTWTAVSSKENTFVDTASPRRIDYILVYDGNSPSYEILGSAVPTYDEINIRTVSDHLPVLVDLKR